MRTTRHRRRPLIAPAMAAALAVGAATATASPDVRLDFGAPVPGTIADSAGQGTGFTTVLSPAAGSTGIVPQNLLLTSFAGDGVLAVTTTDGDAAKAGGSDQDNALAVPITPGVDYTVEARLRGPLALFQDGQSAGVFIGVDQRDYVKLVARQASGSDGLQLRVEQNNAGGPQQTRGVQSLTQETDNELVLRLRVDAAAGTLSGSFSVNGGPFESLGPAIAGPFLTVPGAIAGIISTHPEGGSAITVRYGDFTLDTPPSVEAISPGPDAQGVPTGANVAVTFSDAMNPATVATAVGLVRAADGAPIAASVALGADGRTATVDPVVDLAPSTAYAVTVGTGATDASGYPLLAAAQSGFVTAAPAPPPTIIAQLPPPAQPTTRRPVATRLRAAWNRSTGRVTLRLVGLKGRTVVRVGGRARPARKGVVVLNRSRPGAIVVRVSPRPVAAGLLRPRAWRVVLPARGPVKVRAITR